MESQTNSRAPLQQCKHCGRQFPGWEALMKHKKEMRRRHSKHFHCPICGMDFKTERGEILHIQQDHPEKQNLECPACGHGPFARVGTLMAHIEHDCYRLDVAQLEERRETKLAFPRQLEMLTQEKVKGNYTNYMPPVGAATTALVSQKQPSPSDEYEFPRLLTAGPSAAPGESQQRRENDPPSAWGADTAKSLFPSAPPAQKPTAQQLQAVTEQSVRDQFEAMAIRNQHDPDHLSFNVARYWCSYSEKYLCPHVGCIKAFKKAEGLIGHLKSGVHSGIEYRCPYCMKAFYSLTAITSHAESGSTRCRIRDTNSYGAYLDQLTGGIVDVASEPHADGTVRYQTSKTVREELSQASASIASGSQHGDAQETGWLTTKETDEGWW